PIEAKCAAELFRGIDIVPIDAPTWQYCRYGYEPVPIPVEKDALDDFPDKEIRIHAMVGPSQAVAVNYHYLQPGHDAWQPKGINGWKVQQQIGPYVLCTRA